MTALMVHEHGSPPPSGGGRRPVRPAHTRLRRALAPPLTVWHRTRVSHAKGDARRDSIDFAWPKRPSV